MIKGEKRRNIITGRRCCYLLKNGQRCKNRVLPVKVAGYDGRVVYPLQCAVHSKMCDAKHVKYKKVCDKVFGDLKNLKKCRLKKGATVKNAKACINGRKEWPKRCIGGCEKFPTSKFGNKLLMEDDRKHYFVINQIQQCLKKL